jgi:acetoin utilization protein AcuA
MFRPAAEQHRALIALADAPRCCVSILVDDGEIVGYAAFHPPSEGELWGGDRTGKLIELGAVEVDPRYRGQSLAKRLLQASFAGGRFDDTIVFATLYLWHYDLKHSGLDAFQYQQMLVRLYRSVGMERFRTSDPDIRLSQANALMARIGPACPPEVKAEFDRLRTQPPA